MPTLAINNSTAMIAEKVLQAGLNFLVMAVLARALGPEDFGRFGLVQAVLAVGLPVALVVSEPILIKLLISQNCGLATLQRVALRVKFLSSIFVYSISITFASWYLSDDLFSLTIVYCAIHLINFDLIYFFYFRAIEQSSQVLIAKLYVFVPFAGLKIVAGVFYTSLAAVVWVYVAEALVISLIAWWICRRESSIERDDAKSIQASELIGISWPIFTSAFLIVLYSRIDQFMIDYYLPTAELGYYTLAVKINQASTVVVGAYIFSQFPRLLKLRSTNTKEYNQEIIRTLRICVIVSLLFIGVTVLFGQKIIVTVFGIKFLPSTNVLIVHLSGSIFIYYGMVCTQWLLAENLQIYRLYRVMFGLVLNVILNILFIPAYGILGAAVATLVSQAFSSVFFNVTSEKTRPIFKLQMSSFFSFPRNMS